MKIAVLEQDRPQADLICQVLSAAGHSCQSYDSAKELLGQLRKDSADMLVMDWNVPDMEGTEVLRRAKEKLASAAPTMFLVGNNAEDDIIAGVTAGADDYLVKPLRRGETRPGRLLKDGSVIDVTQKEFSLALLFFRNIGRPLSRAYIHESVWVRENDVPSRTMDTHVSRVRNKLHLRPENGFRLVPVYSYGYRLEKLGA